MKNLLLNIYTTIRISNESQGYSQSADLRSSTKISASHLSGTGLEPGILKKSNPSPKGNGVSL